MARQWRQVSLEEAKQHPLYGVKNWLAVFAFGVLLIPLRELGALASPLNEAGLTLTQFLALNDPFSAYVKGVLTLQMMMASVIYWLLFSKHRSFRVAVSSIWLGYWPAVLLIAFVTQPPKLGAILGETLGLGLISWSLSCLVWVTYLQRSRRVRITFENCVLIESVQPAAPLAQPFPTLPRLETNTAERSVFQTPDQSYQPTEVISARGVASTAQVSHLAKFGPWIFGALCLFALWFNIFWVNDSTISKSAATASSMRPQDENKVFELPPTLNSLVSGALRAGEQNAPPPVPEFSNEKERLEYLQWLERASDKLKVNLPTSQIREEFIQTVWYESKRAGLDPALVLEVVASLSNFRKFYVSKNGARGYMAVNPSWVMTIGNGNVSTLFHMQTNLRFGCVILRHYLDINNGDLQRGLLRYLSDSFEPEQNNERNIRLMKRIEGRYLKWQ